MEIWLCALSSTCGGWPLELGRFNSVDKENKKSAVDVWQVGPSHSRYAHRLPASGELAHYWRQQVYLVKALIMRSSLITISLNKTCGNS